MRQKHEEYLQDITIPYCEENLAYLSQGTSPLLQVK